jgi:hypothetical protein
MNKLRIYLSVFILLFTATSFYTLIPAGKAQAAGDSVGFIAKLVSLPGESLTPEGYLNLSNTGFRVNVTTEPSFETYSLALFVDNQIKPLDERIFDGASDNYLSSNTNSAVDLEELLPEGEHTISLAFKSSKTQPYQVQWSDALNCDYTSPAGSFAATPAIEKQTETQTVIIGETVWIDFAPGVKSNDISTVTGSIYGRALLFHQNPNNKSYFQADYVVGAGDPSITPESAGGLVLNNIEITDIAGNKTEISEKDILIDFNIDTTVPSLSVTSPSLDSQINQGTILTLEGTTDPSAIVVLTINSSQVNVSTTADLYGAWRIQYDTGSLEIGNHSAYLTATNAVGNKTVLNLNNFALVAVESKSNVLAVNTTPSAPVKSASDVKPPVIRRSAVVTTTVSSGENQTQTVATSGRVSTGASTTAPSINWGAWILILALVVLASALATAGYYGYEWISSAPRDVRADQANAETIKPKTSINDVDGSLPSSEKESLKEDEPPKTRW